MKTKDEELLRAEAVSGIPDRVLTQISQVEVSGDYQHSLAGDTCTPRYPLYCVCRG